MDIPTMPCGAWAHDNSSEFIRELICIKCGAIIREDDTQFTFGRNNIDTTPKLCNNKQNKHKT